MTRACDATSGNQHELKFAVIKSVRVSAISLSRSLYVVLSLFAAQMRVNICTY